MDIKSTIYSPIISIITNEKKFDDVHAYIVVKNNNGRISDIVLLKNVSTSYNNFCRLFQRLEKWCIKIVEYLNVRDDEDNSN